MVERDLAGGQRHLYQITLTEGQYFKVEVKQLSSTVLISLQPPDSKTLNVHDLPARKEVLTIEWVAGAPGIYRLDIYSSAKTPAGRYEIRVAQVRPATEDERALQRAQSLYQEYFQLNRAGKYLEARPLMLHALEIRERVLGADHIEVAETLEIIVHNYMLSGDYASAEPLDSDLIIREAGPEIPRRRVIAPGFSSTGIISKQKIFAKPSIIEDEQPREEPHHRLVARPFSVTFTTHRRLHERLPPPASLIRKI